MRRFYQYAAVSSGLLAIVTSGMHGAWGSPTFPRLLPTTNNSAEQYHVTMDQSGWIAMTQPLTGLCTSLVAGTLVDILGRKLSLILGILPQTVAWILIALAKSPTYLYLAKILAGIGDCLAYTALPLYIGEVSDSDIRGFLASGLGHAALFGMLLINVIGTNFTISQTACMALAVPILNFVTFVWMPESPYYLLDKNKPEEASKALAKFKGPEKQAQEMDALKRALNTHRGNGVKIRHLLTKKHNREALLAIVVLRHCQQFTGHSAMNSYMVTIFQQSHIQTVTPEIATVLYCVLQLVTSLISSVLLDRFGRRSMLFISLTGVFLCLLALATIELPVLSTVSVLPMVFLAGFPVSYSLGALNVPMVMMGELFPTSLSAYGSAFDQFYYDVLAAGSSKIFQILDAHWGLWLPFYIFAFLSLLNLFCVYWCVPETRRKTLEEIQNGF